MLRTIVICLSALLTPSLVAAEQYPSRMIRIIVPYSPGGAADTIARLLSAKMSEEFHQQVIVENQAGASAMIGTAAVAKAQPDGYTLGLVFSTHAVNPYVRKGMQYDTARDFDPVTLVALMPLLLVTHPSVQAASLQDLIGLARKQPGGLFYAVPGSLTASQITMEMLKVAAAVDIVPVVYKGAAPAVQDLISGNVQIMAAVSTTLLPHVRDGRLKAIATSGSKREPDLTDIPTISESGLPNIVTHEWAGMLAPAGTPKAVIKLVADAISRAVEKQDVRKILASFSAQPVAKGPDHFKIFLSQEMDKMEALTRKVKLISE